MEATIHEILAAREWRVEKQKELLAKYQKPLLCFTMNIPGPEKWNRDVSAGFAVGNLLLRESLGNIIHYESNIQNTGCTAFYVVDMAPKQLKLIAIDIEHIEHIGRLFDMDVLDINGEKISREDLGHGSRKCLICDKDAWICARSRVHGLEALQNKTNTLLKEATQWLAEHIATTAHLALNQEVDTTPKPGLVDKNNQGSHKDMELQHFHASANALRPYFCKFAQTGYLTRDLDPQDTFRKIRTIGLAAEKAMLGATGGVNTHKGAIFSMGLLCAAAGRIPPHEWTVNTLLNMCASMAKEIVTTDFAGITEENAKTCGEQLYAKYGITGVRGEAETGFPVVKDVALPSMRASLKQGLSINHAGCITLLHLIANTTDTNLINRSSRDRQLEISRQICNLLEKDPYPTLDTIYELDKAFIAENLSPGGCADLLAMTYFLMNIERII